MTRTLRTAVLAVLVGALSACGGPEAPEWLQTYQETGETTLDAAAAEDATAPVATDDVEEPGDATGDQDTPTPDALLVITALKVSRSGAGVGGSCEGGMV